MFPVDHTDSLHVVLPLQQLERFHSLSPFSAVRKRQVTCPPDRALSFCLWITDEYEDIFALIGTGYGNVKTRWIADECRRKHKQESDASIYDNDEVVIYVYHFI